MSYAVILHLDPAAEAAVYDVWSALATTGLEIAMLDNGVRPHVTLASADHIERHALETASATFAATLQPIRLTLSSVGVFGTAEGVLFYGVTPSHGLLDAHAEYGRVFARHSRHPHAYFRAGAWVPHCTLAMGLEPGQLADALAVAWRAPLPIYATAHEMALVHVPAGPIEILNLFQIGRPA